MAGMDFSNMVAGAAGMPESAPSAALAGFKKPMTREAPDVAEGRSSLVKKRMDAIKTAEKRWDFAFKRMEEDIAFVNGIQWHNQRKDDDRILVNIVQTHIKNRVASLYARNPTISAQRKKKLMYRVWDEELSSLAQATMLVQQLGVGAPPDAVMLLQEVTAVKKYNDQLDKLAKTLENLSQQTIDTGVPNFKKQMKRMVCRALVASVGWIKMDFKRTYDLSPEDAMTLNNNKIRLAHIESAMDDLADGEIDEYTSEAEDLKLSNQDLMKSDREYVTEETIIYAFPRANMIILDAKATAIQGFENCDWMAEKFVLSSDQIKDIYKIDVGTKFTRYSREGKDSPGGYTSTLSPEYVKAQEEGFGCVYEQYDKTTGLVYTMLDGYPDFLEEPHEPNVAVDWFFPYLPFTPNEMEENDDIYPKSDVRLMRSIQREYNRSKEALRQHRIAARPLYGAARGSMDKEDKANMMEHADHDIIFFNQLKEGQDVGTIMQSIKKAPIDPNVYETGSLMSDFQRVTGSQEAMLTGATSNGATATDVATASGTTSIGISSSSDDLDEFMSSFADATGKIMMKEYSAPTVMKIVGPGAFWPQLSMEDIMTDVYLRTQAGSSGKPNIAQEISQWERATPLLIQIPGVSPAWVAKKIISLLDTNIDLSEAYVEGIPSIMAQNALSSMPPQPMGAPPGGPGAKGANAGPSAVAGAGDPSSAPGAQGGAGANNAPRGPMPAPGGQPAFPTAMDNAH